MRRTAIFAAALAGLASGTSLHAAATVDFVKDIQPIFQTSCVKCHGPEKQKGGLRLDSLPAVLKGGEDGKVIIPGKSKESPLVLAVARLDEEKAMPPKPTITAAPLEAIASPTWAMVSSTASAGDRPCDNSSL